MHKKRNKTNKLYLRHQTGIHRHAWIVIVNQRHCKKGFFLELHNRFYRWQNDLKCPKKPLKSCTKSKKVSYRKTRTEHSLSNFVQNLKRVRRKKPVLRILSLSTSTEPFVKFKDLFWFIDMIYPFIIIFSLINPDKGFSILILNRLPKSMLHSWIQTEVMNIENSVVSWWICNGTQTFV